MLRVLRKKLSAKERRAEKKAKKAAKRAAATLTAAHAARTLALASSSTGVSLGAALVAERAPSTRAFLADVIRDVPSASKFDAERQRDAVWYTKLRTWIALRRAGVSRWVPPFTRTPPRAARAGAAPQPQPLPVLHIKVLIGICIRVGRLPLRLHAPLGPWKKSESE